VLVNEHNYQESDMMLVCSETKWQQILFCGSLLLPARLAFLPQSGYDPKRKNVAFSSWSLAGVDLFYPLPLPQRLSFGLWS